MKTKKKYRFWKWFYTIISYICLFTPIFIWVIVNRKTYFVQKEGFSVAFGGVLAILGVVLLLKYGIKKIHKLVWVSFLVVIAYCMQTIAKDLVPIMVMCWVGCALFSILEVPTNYYANKLKAYTDEETRMYARQETKEYIEQQEIKEEVKKSKRC